MWLSSRDGSGSGFGVVVVGAGAEHGKQDVAASSGEADEGGVVGFFALGSFAVVVGAAGGVVQGGEAKRKKAR